MGSGTTRASGTSFSSPLVAGIAALIYSRFPGITPLQVRGRLEGNVKELESLRGKVFSDGRVNAGRVFDVDETPPAPITDLQAVDGPKGTVLTWTASGDDGMVNRASFYDIRWLSTPIDADNFRWTKRVLVRLRPGAPGTTEKLTLPADVPAGQFFIVRVLDKVGNMAESNQAEAIAQP